MKTNCNLRRLRIVLLVVIEFLFCCTSFVVKADRQRGYCDNCGNYVASTSKVCPTCGKNPHYNEDALTALFYSGNEEAFVKGALLDQVFGIKVYKQGDKQPSVKGKSSKSKKSKSSKKQKKKLTKSKK